MSCSWTGMSICARTGTWCTRMRIRGRDRLEPRRDDALAVGLASHDERGHLQRLLAHVDDVVGGDLEGRDVDLLAVDLEVTVHDELAGVAAGAGEAGAVDHVVEAALEQLQQVVTGLALRDARPRRSSGGTASP